MSKSTQKSTASPPKSKSTQAGYAAEAKAAAMYVGEGYAVVAQNVNFPRYGELDLVLEKGEWLVFSEVRARQSQRFGGALASVTAAKQRKLRRAAGMFLANHPKFSKHLCRFDVVALEGDELIWIQGAF